MDSDTDTKIGFDAKRIVANGTGLGSYGRTLVNALTATKTDYKFILYAPDQGRADLRQQIEPRPNVSFAYPAHLHFRLQRDMWRAHGIVKDLQKDGIRLYHGLSGELPKGLSDSGILGVATIHDLIFMRHPEWYNRADVWLYKRKFLRTLREADRLIAISECTKRDILELSNYPEDRIDVVYQSCAKRFAAHVAEDKLIDVHASYSLPERYILNVGSIEERKNAMLALKSLKYLPSELSLVIVGRRTPYTDQLLEYAARQGLFDRLHILHNVPDDDLPAIYQMSECFVYPSRYEGFGIPIIEAIQRGLPVVACTGSCLEEAGGPSCIYVDPDDARAMAGAIEKVISERDKRVAASQQYIKKFENADVAAQILAIYDKLLNK